MNKPKYGESKYSQRGAEGYPLAGFNKAIRTADGKTVVTSYDLDGKPVHSEVIDYREQAAKPILKLILRQATYFLLLMLAIGVGLAVFL